MPAKTKMAANKLPVSNFPRETSPTWAGASAVAGVADAAATTGAFAAATGGAGCGGAAAGFDCATAGCSCNAGAAAEAGAPADATGVSTTGEKFGAGEVGISSGLAGLPAANDSGGTADDCETAVLAAASSGLGAVASIPAINGAAAVFALDSDPLPFATAAPGIWLGAISGLDSFCASAKAVSASGAGAGHAARAGRCLQPRS